MSSLKHYLAVLKEQPSWSRFLASRVLWQTGLCRFFEVDRGDYSLRFTPSFIAASFWAAPHKHRWEDRIIQMLVGPVGTYVDVGANIGALSCAAAAKHSHRRALFAFEPHPATFAVLQENLRLNGFSDVQSFHFAVGSNEGQVTLSDEAHDQLNHVIVDGATGISVPMCSLDRFEPLSRVASIELLKIDVEGYEWEVFQGAKKTLERTRFLWFEVSNEHDKKFGHQAAELMELLLPTFALFQRSGEMTFRALPPNYKPTAVHNVLGIHRGVLSALNCSDGTVVLTAESVAASHRLSI